VTLAAPKTKPPLGLAGAEAAAGVPNENAGVVAAAVESVDDTVDGAPKVKEEAAVDDFAAASPNLKVEIESLGLEDAAGAPKLKADEDALEVAPARLNPPDDIAPGIILGPEAEAGVGAVPPDLGDSQQMHFSRAASLGTMQVSQVHFEAAAALGATAAPGFAVSQQTHFVLSASFWTRHVPQDHLVTVVRGAAAEGLAEPQHTQLALSSSL